MTQSRVFFSITTLLLFGTIGVFAVQPVDPLVRTATFTPTVTFSESHSEKVVATVVPMMPTTYDAVPSRSCTATVVANITGIDLASIGGGTTFSLTLGGMHVSFLLGSIPNYSVGQTTAFYCWNGWDIANKAKDKGGVKLVWTATKLTVTVTMANEATRPLPIGTDTFLGAVTDTGGKLALKDTLTAEITFGTISSSAPRTLYITGSSSVTHAHSSLYDLDLNSVTLVGTADYTLPTIALLTPKQGSSVTADAIITGSTTDTYGLAGVEWTDDLNAAWTATPDFSFTSQPADGLWGTNSATWIVTLTGLPHGTDKIWVRSIDDSGNTSTPLLVTLVNPMPIVLTGRWDALLVPDVTNGQRGAITFTFSANGSYTGTLTLEGASYPVTGSLAHDETLTQTLKATHQPNIDLSGTIVSFTSPDDASASITGSLKIASASIATFTAFRSPWSTTKLADVSLTPRFHLQIAAPAAAADPTGNGYAVITTARAGSASAAFALADGSVVTWSGVMGATGQLPMFARLYGSNGSISGLASINKATRSIPATTLTWVRPASFTDKQFPLGFNYNLAASGSAYTAPSPAITRVMSLLAPVAPATTNATTTWSGTGVTSSTQTFTVNASNTLTIPTNADLLKFALVPGTGLWTGSFKIPGTANVLSTCKLIIVGNHAYGHWTAPAPVTVPVTLQKRYGVIHVQ